MKPAPGRRQFLKGLIALGAGIYAMPVISSISSKPPLTLVFSGHVQVDHFLAGLAHGSSVKASSFPVFQPDQWAQFILKHHGQRLVGLMDNASFVIFEAVLADQGARFLVTGHHAQGHQFITVPKTAGVASALDSCWTDRSDGYLLEETCRGTPEITSTPAFADVYQGGPDWREVTGACYARIANGDWSAGLPGNFTRKRRQRTAATNALVSFVVEV